jgi:hypothetical protein
MASQTTIIRITHAKAGSELGGSVRLANIPSTQPRQACIELAALLDRIAAGGERDAIVDLRLGGTIAAKASGTITFTSAIASTNVQVCQTVFASVADNTGSPTVLQFKIGSGGGAGQDHECAVNFAAKVNAHTATKGLVVATVATNVVTITALQPGLTGNMIEIASSSGEIVASAATITGGTGDDVASVVYSRS